MTKKEYQLKKNEAIILKDKTMQVLISQMYIDTLEQRIKQLENDGLRLVHLHYPTVLEGTITTSASI